jgi:hypothetical protein
MQNAVDDTKEYKLEESIPHDNVNSTKEKALAELYKVCPEITQVVKEKLGDTTTLWALAAIARLATNPDMFELEIRIVSDILRQRALDGANGDTAHAKHCETKKNEPQFLKKVTLGSLPKECGAILIKRLNEIGFSHSKANGWWAWENKERRQFMETLKRDGVVTQGMLIDV